MNMLTQFVLFMIAFFVVRTIIRFAKNLNQEYNEFKEKECQKCANEVLVRIEKLNNQFFLYNYNTEQFLAQGKTREEVEDVLKKRFPDTAFCANTQNMKDTKFEL